MGFKIKNWSHMEGDQTVERERGEEKREKEEEEEEEKKKRTEEERRRSKAKKVWN